MNWGQPVALVVLLVLSACALTKPPVAKVSSSAKSVAVLVAIPPEIHLAASGITVFENSLEFTQVPDWHMETVVLDAAGRALSPRYQIAYSQTDTQFVDSEAPVELAFEKYSAIQTFAREHAKPNTPVDLVIVICLIGRLQPDLNGPIFKGIGVSKLRDPFVTRTPVAHSLIAVTIMDGSSFNIVTQTAMRVAPTATTQWPSINGANYPEAALDGLPWKDHWAEYSADQRGLIRAKILDLLSTSTIYTLRTTLGMAGS